MRTAMVLCVGVLAGCSASDEDLFVGVFESETRENFGSVTQGEYRIEVVAASTDTYVATIYRRETLLGTRELVRCPVEREARFRRFSPGRAEVLCSDDVDGFLDGFLSFSENGISVAAIKPKYANSPELVRQEGLEPGDPSLFESRHHKAKYYAHVLGYFFGFRKVR